MAPLVTCMINNRVPRGWVTTVGIRMNATGLRSPDKRASNGTAVTPRVWHELGWHRNIQASLLDDERDRDLRSAVYMSYTSPKFRLFHEWNLSVLSFWIFLAIYIRGQLSVSAPCDKQEMVLWAPDHCWSQPDVHYDYCNRSITAWSDGGRRIKYTHTRMESGKPLITIAWLREIIW